MTTAATTPIQTFKDILDAMERDPQLQEALRQYVLDEEIRRLPAAFPGAAGDRSGAGADAPGFYGVHQRPAGAD